MPVTPQNMNYVSVVVVGLVSFVIVLWFTSKRGKFTGPKINMQQLTQRRLAAIKGGELTDGLSEDVNSLEESTALKK